MGVGDGEGRRAQAAQTSGAWGANRERSGSDVVAEVGIGRARVWLLYLTASAVQFDHFSISIHLVLAVRTRDGGASAMPRTRQGWA